MGGENNTYPRKKKRLASSKEFANRFFVRYAVSKPQNFLSQSCGLTAPPRLDGPVLGLYWSCAKRILR